MRALTRFACIWLALLPTAITACGSTGPGGPTPGPSASAAGTQASSPAVTQVATGSCIDGTSSSASGYAIQMRAILADAVAGWAPPPAANPTSTMKAQPGLRVVLRSITTTPYSTDDSSLDNTIPAVPGLAAQPVPSDNPSFSSQIHAWTQQRTSWEQAAAAAARAAAALAGQVRRFPIARNTWSGIYSCIAAVATQLAPAHGPGTRIAVLSDMQNNRPVTGLALDGDAVLMVTICPANVSTTCPQRFAAARSLLLQHGASSVTIIRADAVTAGTFDAFWGAG